MRTSDSAGDVTREERENVGGNRGTETQNLLGKRLMTKRELKKKLSEMKMERGTAWKGERERDRACG